MKWRITAEGFRARYFTNTVKMMAWIKYLIEVEGLTPSMEAIPGKAR